MHATGPLIRERQGQTPAPLYFAFAANKNRESRALLDEGSLIPAMDLEELLKHQRGGAVVIDARDDLAFAQGHLTGSINIGLTGRFAEYAGQVMAPGTPIILITDPGSEDEAKTRLARIGFDHVLGALTNPLETMVANPELVERLSRLSTHELAERMKSINGLVSIDVRNVNEVALGSIPGALKVSLSTLLGAVESLDRSAPTVVFCAGGYRSAIASSLLRSHGFSDVSDLIGGYAAWGATNVPAVLPAITVGEVANKPDSVLLDVREDDEWGAGHAPKALHVAMQSIAEHVGELDRDRQVICVCRSGSRSARVTAWLIAEGFDAINMTGGMQAWEASGQRVVDQDGLPGVVT